MSKMQIFGTIVPPTTGHLPIAFEIGILYDSYNLSNETQSLPGSGSNFKIWMASSNAAHTLAGILLLEKCSGQFISITHQGSR
jgi:hypothetical protein